MNISLQNHLPIIVNHCKNSIYLLRGAPPRTPPGWHPAPWTQKTPLFAGNCFLGPGRGRERDSPGPSQVPKFGRTLIKEKILSMTKDTMPELIPE